MMPNDCELGLSPGPVNGGKAVFKRNQGKMSPLMNAEKSKFIGLRKNKWSIVMYNILQYIKKEPYYMSVNPELFFE